MQEERGGSLVILIFLVVAGLIVFLDQTSKVIVAKFLIPGESIPLLEGIFHLTYIKNTGIAFGLFPNYPNFFLVTILIIIVGVSLYYFKIKPKERLVQIALGFEAGGAISNLVDRVTKGAVTDFLDFRFWPVFNFADSAIVVGLILMIWVMVLSRPRSKKHSSRDMTNKKT